MLTLLGIHHIAIVCSDIEESKRFYSELLGFKIEREVYRSERDSFKIDLSLNGMYTIELFSFPNSPKRLTRPEANGLRHLAFAVAEVQWNRDMLISKGIDVEPIRIDEHTGKKFVFFEDPDGLPIELYEV